ncbi:hypothetical protein EJV47_14645 [Hymenobacter gummosus]|uniref:AAA+ ATPase domain-containing protein n=1 Tax=Hymenobacter gummosus TaxID=1776032 RepID=A0A431U159_9BACT|nr:AAA family ATPase [Hymenobacter gummosus]RTQ48835.1 hypothetical protein EJV47_14645 [Hymenobacter gummosus]
MLRKIALKRFKKFQDSTVELKPFTILMGENSSGKTTVLQAINISLSVIFGNKLIFDKDGLPKVKQGGTGLYDLPGVYLSNTNELWYRKKSIGGKVVGEQANPSVDIDLFDENNNVYRVNIRTRFGSYNVKCSSSDIDLLNQPDLHRKIPLFITGFVGLRVTEERTFPAFIRETMRSGEASSVIRNLLFDIWEKNKDNYNRLKDRLFKDFGFSLDSVEFDSENDIFVKAQYSEELGKDKFALDFNSSGSGFMQILQILAPIYRFCPEISSIVLLDEPDAHLHPNLQNQLANTLREIQKEFGIQIIVSTHSTSIIRAADPSEVVPVSAKNKANIPLTNSDEVEQEIISRIDTYELAKTALSGQLIFIEDNDTSILEAIDRTLEANCIAGSTTIPVIRGRGKDDRTPFNIKDVLKEVLKKDIKVSLMLDRDGLSNMWVDKLKDYAKKKKVNMHILDVYEIENYLLCPESIYAAITAKYGDMQHVLNVVVIKEKIAQFLKQTIVHNRYKYREVLKQQISKLAVLLNDDEFRSNNAQDREVDRIINAYYDVDEFDELLKIGMGKETLKEIFKWLETKSVNIGRRDIINKISLNNKVGDFRAIFQSLS